MAETPTKTPSEANLKPAWKKGDPSPNPSGRPKGAISYTTLRRKAFERIGKARDMTPEEVEELMVTSGLEKALQGEATFYKDDLDRAYGKPQQNVGIGDFEGEPLTVRVVHE